MLLFYIRKCLVWALTVFRVTTVFWGGWWSQPEAACHLSGLSYFLKSLGKSLPLLDQRCWHEHPVVLGFQPLRLLASFIIHVHLVPCWKGISCHWWVWASGDFLSRYKKPAFGKKGSLNLQEHIPWAWGNAALGKMLLLVLTLEPGSPGWLPWVGHFGPCLQAVKGHCQICLTSQFMFRRGWWIGASIPGQRAFHTFKKTCRVSWGERQGRDEGEMKGF